jgi:uncharacterized protein (DUF488 family)
MAVESASAAGVIYTVGHSTRTFDELVSMLRAHGVDRIVDVRRYPHSRRNPQFDGRTLARRLRARGIRYRHEERLGGRRRPRRDSPNTAWRSLGFRGFADYMATPGFQDGLEVLESLARRSTTAILCAEAVPWRCHRSLISDALTARGAEVRHILGVSPPRKHRRTAFARVRRGKVSYPPARISTR